MCDVLGVCGVLMVFGVWLVYGVGFGGSVCGEHRRNENATDLSDKYFLHENENSKMKHSGNPM